MINNIDRAEEFFSERQIFPIAGIDEAGRGPLAGPVIASCVIFPKTLPSPIPKIDDSKKLSEKERNVAFWYILKHCHIGIGLVNEKVIDQINIYNATIIAMEMALQTIKICPKYILIDGRIKISTSVPYLAIEKGDSRCKIIAAASIVSKVVRDRIMHEYDQVIPGYNFRKHKGYPTREHYNLIAQLGLSKIHRLSFNTSLN